MVLKLPQPDGRVVWIGTNQFRVGGLKGAVTKKLRKGIPGIKNIKTLPGLIKRLEKIQREEGYQRTKAWLLEHDFSPRMVREMLVYMPDQGRITTRGALHDTLSYEFFGVPQGTQPNIENFRPWVERVVQRDPKMKEEYDQKTEKGKENMIKQLTFLFSRSVKEKGLQRNYTIGELDPFNPDKVAVFWQGQRRVVERYTPSQPWRSKKLEQAARVMGDQKLLDYLQQRGHP